MAISKAQTSMEFMLIFVIFLLILSVIAWVSLSKTQEMSFLQLSFEVRKVLSDISDKIDTAHLEGSGFSANLTLPQDIIGYNYSLQIESNQVLLSLDSITFSKLLITKNITGTLKKGSNIIKNENGGIVIV